jgi:hypothetical protein
MSEPADSQRMGRILHQAMEEVLGSEGLRSILVAAQKLDGGMRAGDSDGTSHSDSDGAEFIENGRFSSSRLNSVFGALGDQYGPRVGRGLALRIGRACFQYGLREFGESLGLTATSFRLLPFPVKLNKFAGALSSLFTSSAGQSVRVEKQAGKLLWRMEPCPFCEEGASQDVGCLLPVGLAEESLYWLSGGKIFSVEEIACIARGDPACTLQVDETPLS